MDQAFARMLAALELAVRLSLPVLGAAFAIGLVMAIVQAWSRVGEPALSAIPRALVTLVVLGGTGAWVGRELLAYTVGVFRALPELVR